LSATNIDIQATTLREHSVEDDLQGNNTNLSDLVDKENQEHTILMNYLSRLEDLNSARYGGYGDS